MMDEEGAVKVERLEYEGMSMSLSLACLAEPEDLGLGLCADSDRELESPVKQELAQPPADIEIDGSLELIANFASGQSVTIKVEAQSEEQLAILPEKEEPNEPNSGVGFDIVHEVQQNIEESSLAITSDDSPHIQMQFTGPKPEIVADTSREIGKVEEPNPPLVSDTTPRVGYVCPKCCFTFKQAKPFKVHMMSVHGDDKPFECPDCDYRANTCKYLTKHRRIHSNIKKSKEPILDALVTSQELRKASDKPNPDFLSVPLQQVQQNFNETNLMIASDTSQVGHKSGLQYACTKCCFACNDIKLFKVHMISEHDDNKSFSCTDCKYRATPCKYLTRRRRAHSKASNESGDPGLGICAATQEVHTDSGACAATQEVYTESGDPGLGICAATQEVHTESDDVRSVISSQELLQKFEKRRPDITTDILQEVNKTSDLEYACPHCSFICKYSKQFKAHAVSVHGDDKPFRCPDCDYRATTCKYLTKHRQVHSEMTKRFVCDICGHKCRRSSHLIVHKRTHTGEKPYSCNQCSFQTARETGLLAHQRMHAGVRPFKCTQCSYSACEAASLKRHLKTTHAVVKSLKCPLCDFASTLPKYIKLHMGTHTNERPFSCEHCNYCSRTQYYLKLHVMRKHPSSTTSLLKCKQCDFTTNSKYKHAQHRHIHLHGSLKVYNCDLCTFKTVHSTSITQHLAKHCGINHYECDLCPYKTNSQTHLSRHRRIHIKKVKSCSK